MFTNNRVSSVLDTGKDVDLILESPHLKHDDTPGFAALVEHQIDDAGTSATALVSCLQDPNLKLSEEPTDAPFNKAFKFPRDVFDFYEQPGQEYRRSRFGVAMQGVSAMFPPEAILKGFNWMSLTNQDTIVDVGSGVGSVSLALARANLEVKIILQDRAPVIEHAAQVWANELPEAVESGRIRMLAHDFFTEQPVKNATIFLMKQIMHDWSDKYATKILKQLHAAAMPSTRVLLVESLTSYACHDPHASSIPGAIPHEAPAPLIANYGPVNDMQYNGDLTVFVQNNAQERTIDHMVALCNGAGWKVVRIYRSDGMSGFMQQMEAVKIV